MPLKIFLVLIVIFLLGLSVGACTRTTCGDSEWQDITWKLKSYGFASNLQPVVGNANITLEFKSSDREVGGSGGCNHYFGGYTVNSNCELQISGLGATEMACMDSALMQQEQKYFNLLQNADRIEAHDGELRINSGTEVLVYTQ